MADLIAFRNEVLTGIRPKITLNHLAAVKMQCDNWQAIIDEDKLSITFHAAQEVDEQEAIIQDKHPMTKIPITELQTGQTMTMDNLVISTQTLTGQTVTVTNTQDQLQYNPLDMSPGQAIHDYADGPLQDSVAS